MEKAQASGVRDIVTWVLFGSRQLPRHRVAQKRRGMKKFGRVVGGKPGFVSFWAKEIQRRAERR
eukprot:8819837-Alexandrium_andersonii.AAC.1